MFKSKAMLALLIATVASGASASTMASAAQAADPEMYEEYGAPYTGTIGAFKLELPEGTHVTCAASGSTSSGVFTGGKTMTAVLHLRGCSTPPPKLVCGTAGAAKGEIVTQELQGTFVYIDPRKPGEEAGYVFKPVTGENIVSNFSCEHLGPSGNIRGSIIGVMATPPGWITEFTLLFKQSRGHQEPNEYQEREFGPILHTSLESNWYFPKEAWGSMGWALEEAVSLPWSFLMSY